MSSSVPGGGDTPRAFWGLAVLVVLALYTAMDRQVIGLLAQSLQRDLGINDTQFGLLQGAGVVLFAAAAGYPVAWLADRQDRRLVLAACLALWSLALVGCSLASNYSELFVVSTLMGAAEAGVIPIAYALIADRFSTRRRQTATSVFVLTGRLGAGLMIVASGMVVASADVLRRWMPHPWHGAPEWSVALFATALPALLVVPALLLMPLASRTSSTAAEDLGRHAERAGEGPAGRPGGDSPSSRHAVWAAIAGLTLLGGGAGALGVFMPVLVQRMSDLSASQAGAALGMATLAAASVALAVTAGLARWGTIDAAGRPGLSVAALALLIGALGAGGISQAATPTAALVLYAASLGGTMTAVILLVGILQSHAPIAARARFMAVVTGATATAAALTPIAAGMLSDAGGGGAVALATAMTMIGTPCYLLSAAGLAWAARPPRTSSG